MKTENLPKKQSSAYHPIVEVEDESGRKERREVR
jgi:hypothetical protein